LSLFYYPQIDVKTGTAERLRRAMDAFVDDKGRDPHVPTLFEDAQHTVFNELLPFWAGFVTAMSPSEREGTRPGILILLPCINHWESSKLINEV